MAAWRYEISLLVLKKYEEKFRISAQPCNILYVTFLSKNKIRKLIIHGKKTIEMVGAPSLEGGEGRGQHFSALHSLECKNSCLSDLGILFHNFVASLCAPVIKYCDDRVGI